MAAPMSPGDYLSLSGDDFRQMVEAGTHCVEQHVDAINALNVFPVPDGDTGTNMLLTLRSASMAELPEPGSRTVAAVSEVIAHAALLGARGNSGVIFSQYLKGLAAGLKGCADCDGPSLQKALTLAAEAAYHAVGKPVEGTMLTVMRAAAHAAELVSQPLPELWQTAFRAAEEALAHTPEQLAVLKKAGVVDAGGQGVVAFMAGAQAFLTGATEASLEIISPRGTLGNLAAARVSHTFFEHTDEELYGYCTQFIIHGESMNVDRLREQVVAMAESTVVVGDRAIVRVHAHVEDPGPLLSLGASLGALDQIKIENMDTMHLEFMAQHGYVAEQVPVAVVAVASGEGLERAFRELGAAVVVRGGQTMNPSAGDLLDAARRSGGEQVVLLPNNPNVLLAAQQAQVMEGCRCAVVPSHSIPQGVAALLAFNPDLDANANLKAMTAALATVRSGEVTTAVRDSTVDGVNVSRGQAIAFLDRKLKAAAVTPQQALIELLSQAKFPAGTLITLYWGGDIAPAEARQTADAIRERWPEAEVELIQGGQPHYHFFVSIE
jgi:DAK2 domain fusion protein YloV